jgi:hypothetical protein
MFELNFAFNLGLSGRHISFCGHFIGTILPLITWQMEKKSLTCCDFCDKHMKRGLKNTKTIKNFRIIE